MGKDKNHSVTDAACDDQAPPRKKKRRWLRRLIAVVVLLVALVFIAPYVAASGPVRRWILSSVNDCVRGRIEIGELSLGWFSAPRAGHIVVRDPQGKQVLSIREIRIGKSLIGLAFSPMHFGRVEVQDPNMQLIASAGGGYTIDKAFESTSPPKPKTSTSKLPDIRGTIIVRGGSITLVNLAGKRLALTDAASDVDIQSLDKLTGKQTVRLPGGSVVTTEYALTGLASDGEFPFGNVSGMIDVSASKPADLEPIGEFVLPAKGLTGTARLSANVKFDRGMPDGQLELAMVNVKADQGYDKAKPATFTITATAVPVDSNTVRGKMLLSGPEGGIGRFEGTYHYQVGAKPDFSAEKIVDALLTGKAMHLPPMGVDANGQIDLAAVAAAVPSLLQLRHDVTVTGGAVALDTLAIRGGESPSIKIAAGMRDVVATRKDANGTPQAIDLKPVRADFDSALENGMGLNVRVLKFDSAYAHLDGSGTPKSFHAQYNANLKIAAEEIGKIIDLGKLKLAGRVNGEAGANMDENQTLGYNLGANVMALAVGKGNLPAKDDPNALKFDTATLLANGRLTHGRDKDTKLFVDQVRLFAETWLEVDGRAEMNVTSGAMDANANIKNADLAGLWGEVRAMGHKDPNSLAGTLSGNVTITRKGEQTPLVVNGLLVGENLAADGNSLLPQGKPLQIKLADLTVSPDGGPVAWKLATLDYGQMFVVSSWDRFDPATGTTTLEGKVQRGDLAGLLKTAQAFGLTTLGKPITGSLGGQVTASRQTSQEPFAVEGNLTLKQLRIDNKPVGKKDAELTLSGVKAIGPSVFLAARQIRLTSDVATVTMKDLDVQRGEKLSLAGNIEAKADLALVARVVNAFDDPDAEPVALAGTLKYSGKASKAGPDIALTGSGSIPGFRVGAGDKAVAIEPLTFSQDIRISPDTRTIRIQQFTVKSDMLDLTASGTITHYDTTQTLNIRGHYKGDWSKIMAVAHELAPATSDIAVTGPIESDFVLTGPANQPKLTPVYRDMDANAAVGWQTARLLGFELGKADVPVTFAKGRVVVPRTQIPATGGGEINIGATVDLVPTEPQSPKPAPPQLHMPGELTVLKGVQINKEIGQQVLSRLNPVFGQLLSLQGRITLVTRDIDVPLLGNAIKKRGTGSGRVDLSELQIEPAGFMGKLLELGGLGGKQLVKVGAVDFVIKDGALTYDNFTMSFGKDFDLRFRGAVRFDDSVDLFVSVPVKAALLKKLGVGGKAETYANLLDGVRVEIPVLGTRNNPKLDMAKVDVKPLIQKATESLLKKQGGGLLKGLLDSLEKKKNKSDGQK